MTGLGLLPFQANVVSRASSPIQIACKEGNKLVLQDYFKNIA